MQRLSEEEQEYDNTANEVNQFNDVIHGSRLSSTPLLPGPACLKSQLENLRARLSSLEKVVEAARTLDKAGRAIDEVDDAGVAEYEAEHDARMVLRTALAECKEEK